jgi:hypothetical protein
MNLVTNMDKLFLEKVAQLDLSKLNERNLTVVKVGGSDYVPTPKDLETWKKTFEEAKADKDFTVFTHPDVQIQQYKLAPDEAISIPSPGEVKVMPPREIVAASGQLSMNFADKPTEEESKAIKGALEKLNKNVKLEPEGAVAVTKEVTKEKKPVDDKKLAEEIARDQAAEDARLAELEAASKGVEEATKAIEDLNSEVARKQREVQEERDAKEIAKKVAAAKNDLPPDAAKSKKGAFRRVEEPE